MGKQLKDKDTKHLIANLSGKHFKEKHLSTNNVKFDEKSLLNK
jgi:hypothetical protein